LSRYVQRLLKPGISSHPSLPLIFIKNKNYDEDEETDEDENYDEDRSFIIHKLGTLGDVFRKRSLSPTSQNVYHCLGMSNYDEYTVEL